MSTHHGILLHVVFSAKYRKPLLADSWRDDLFGYGLINPRATLRGLGLAR